MTEHFDVIIVGAGLSGISAAYHLQTRCPGKTFAILEARDAIGGTWDLFRYPGIRSDSDMYTLGYRWRPWPGAKAIADGPSILTYVRESARENGLDHKLRLGHRLQRAAWSSEHSRWTLDVQRASGNLQISCNFLYNCSGYFDYSAGYKPEFEAEREFTGRVVHPQHWPQDLDWSGKRVVVIGSGATAMTLVPSMADKAAHVTMLQRSPTYVLSVPAVDAVAGKLRDSLPPKAAYGLTRWKNVVLGGIFFQLSRRAPNFVKKRLLQGVQAQLGVDFDVGKHFTPRYNPWDQRMCLVPDGDLFRSLRSGKVSVVTDHIARFTPTGLRLQSGQHLDADIVVTATGLELQFLGGAQLSVDGRDIEPGQSISYRGCMLCDVPNLAYTFGYTNASWTLKADLTAEYVCRTLREMDRQRSARCTPRRRGPGLQAQPLIDFSSGYVERNLWKFPKQGSAHPFRVYQNYLLDLLTLRYGRLADGVLEFAKAPSVRSPHDTATGNKPQPKQVPPKHAEPPKPSA